MFICSFGQKKGLTKEAGDGYVDAAHNPDAVRIWLKLKFLFEKVPFDHVCTPVLLKRVRLFLIAVCVVSALLSAQPPELPYQAHAHGVQILKSNGPLGVHFIVDSWGEWRVQRRDKLFRGRLLKRATADQHPRLRGRPGHCAVLVAAFEGHERGSKFAEPHFVVRDFIRPDQVL